MMVDLETLLDELALRHARGEPLDVEGTLRRAGDRADELAPLIEAFLARAPRREPTPRALAFVRSLDDPPMVRARVAKALKVDDVVDAIVTECELDPGARPKVRRYYQQLEGGILDPTRVAATVWDVITDLLGRSRAVSRRLSAGRRAAAPMYRADTLFGAARWPPSPNRTAGSSRPTRWTRSSSVRPKTDPGRTSVGRRAVGHDRVPQPSAARLPDRP